MGTKCIKLALKYIDDKLDKKEMNNILKEIQYKTWLACNKAITNYFYKDNVDIIQKDIGIKEEDKEKIFEKFSRIDNPLTRKIQGSGLGLYITKTLVEKMRGNISVKNLEKGVEFL